MNLESIVSHSLDEVRELISQSKTSLFEDYGSFKLFIVRRVSLKEKDLSFPTHVFIIKPENKEVFHFNSAEGSFEPLNSGYESFLHQLEAMYAENLKAIAAYSLGVERLEDFLYERSTPNYFMDLWFDLKSALSKLENYYYRASIVYHEFHKNLEPELTEWKDEFKDIEESITFQISNIKTLAERLDGVHKYYESIKGDRMNKTLLSLTVISGIFLPLNLIVGFFGMNTPGLFFQNDPQGTERVIVILGGVVLFFLVGFKVVRVLDYYVLRFILGRYDFYKNLTSKLEDFDSRMRGR